LSVATWVATGPNEAAPGEMREALPIFNLIRGADQLPMLD
jgi:hypothetical protein